MSVELTKHSFGKGKKQTNHTKGVPPSAASKKRRSGPVSVHFVNDYNKRIRTQSTRTKGLWNKAYELAVMTGISMRLQIRNEYFDSVEAGISKEPPVMKQPLKAAETCTSIVSEETTTQETTVCTELSDPSLSPRMLRPQGPSMPTISKSTTPNHLKDDEVSAKTSRDAGVQCLSITAIPVTGIDKQCRYCGGLFEADSRNRQKIWIGCDKQECNYWLHADCLLGKSTKITPTFVKSLPFLCPAHK